MSVWSNGQAVRVEIEKRFEFAGSIPPARKGSQLKNDVWGSSSITAVVILMYSLPFAVDNAPHKQTKKRTRKVWVFLWDTLIFECSFTV